MSIRYGASGICPRHTSQSDWLKPQAKRWTALAFISAVGVSIPSHAQPPSMKPASTEPELTITLRVYNYAHLETAVLAESEAVVAAIFRQAGVDTVWIDCPLSPAESASYPTCRKEMGTTDFVLRILTPPMAMKTGTRDDPLGYAPQCPEDEPACPLSIFYYRIDGLAATGHARTERLLGHAIAHEIGHLLLGSRAHSPAGIMRGIWSHDDLKSMAWRYLVFTPDQRDLLRASLVRRTKMTDSSWKRSFDLSRVRSITVLVYDYAQVPERTLAEAQKQVARIFGSIGIIPDWLRCPISAREVQSNPVCQDRLSDSELALTILPEFKAPAHGHADTYFGFAQLFSNGQFGHYAYVFYNHVEDCANRGPASASQVLAYVAAHELGHLLLRSSAHSSSGLMRRGWDRNDL
jgi:hypothetical protein